MSGRRARAGAARNSRILEAYRKAQPVFLHRDGAMEWWRKGQHTVEVPALLPDYPEALTDACRTRRRAIFDGHCACGALVRFAGRGVMMRHRRNCPAGENVLARLAGAAGVATEP